MNTMHTDHKGKHWTRDEQDHKSRSLRRPSELRVLPISAHGLESSRSDGWRPACTSWDSASKAKKKKTILNLHIPKIWPQIYMCICNTSTWRNRAIHNNNEIILVTDITTRLKLIRKQLWLICLQLS